MTIELTLPNMTCGHCVKTVTATAQRLAGLGHLAHEENPVSVARAIDEFVAAL